MQSAKKEETMQKQWINQNWTLRGEGVTGVIGASVPGSVYNDLLNAGQMEDPFWRDNEYDALKRMEKDYIYETCFDVAQELMCGECMLLRFEGLDTLTEIRLNGALLGKTDNMHRTYEFEVKPFLKPVGNRLEVTIFSSLAYIRKCHETLETIGCIDAVEGFPQLRKGHSMFGWDWGPRIPDAGIFRDVSLLSYDTARLSDFYVTQRHEAKAVTLGITAHIKALDKTADKASYEYVVLVTDPGGNAKRYAHSPKEIVIRDPKLWWPAGFGAQPLYTVEVLLYENEKLLDAQKKRIGLRTMTVRRDKDAYGESFCHEVNGKAIFAMGADYIPMDNVLGRITRERTRKLLEQCKESNFNCVRVWGGGWYPDDYFFDICDELGLIVWMDFMFACAVYELTEEFEENIKAEFADNIKRIRNHACLGLWCGNNEMEYFLEGGGWGESPKQKSDYVKMYEYILPKMISQYDPETFYWPASPSSGGGFDNSNDENRGDVHYWDVWHGGKPFTEYRKFYFRYASEFGFQSFPAAKTVESFTLPKDRNIFSYVMEKHQRNNSANGRMMQYMEQTFLYPTDFYTVLYASQLMQAEAMRCGVEHFRRNRGRCMGTVYWQLNDIWPGASWSSIDYFGRLKALQYYAKRFFAPVLLSCEERGMHTESANVNAQPKPYQKSVRFNVSNETLKARNVTVVWHIRKASGVPVRSERADVTAAPLSAEWLDEMMLPELSVFEEYVSYELWENGQKISEDTALFAAPKFFRYEDPKLTVTLLGDEIIVRTLAYAQSVEIQNEDEDLVLEDNYFSMSEGERRVKILSGEPRGLRVRSVYDIR